jgi:recombination endonuclease VII
MTRRARQLAKYGLTERQEKKLLQLQGGKCAICQRPPKTRRLHIDHDHRTKRVRGALCFGCNRYCVSKNDAESAYRVWNYLDSPFDGRNL